MATAVHTAWNPPPTPERDLWWHAQRIAAPDTTDPVERHRRGVVRLPYDLNDEPAGTLVPAWVCCDPACGGVELSQIVLEQNHGCCVPPRCCPPCDAAWTPPRRHMVGLGRVYFRGWFHGPFTAWWEPGGAR